MHKPAAASAHGVASTCRGSLEQPRSRGSLCPSLSALFSLLSCYVRLKVVVNIVILEIRTQFSSLHDLHLLVSLLLYPQLVCFYGTCSLLQLQDILIVFACLYSFY